MKLTNPGPAGHFGRRSLRVKRWPQRLYAATTALPSQSELRGTQRERASVGRLDHTPRRRKLPHLRAHLGQHHRHLCSAWRQVLQACRRYPAFPRHRRQARAGVRDRSSHVDDRIGTGTASRSVGTLRWIDFRPADPPACARDKPSLIAASAAQNSPSHASKPVAS